MVLKEIYKDIFTVPREYCLAHCISSDYALGAGIAKVFDTKYDMRFKLHRDFTIPEVDKFVYVGKALLVENVFNLVTKKRFFNKPSYDMLQQTLIDMKQQLVSLSIAKLAMPRIGCGLDGLNWNNVKSIIEDVFGDTNIEILICIL